MASQKLPMDLLTTYRKDYIKMETKRPPPYKADRDYKDPMSGPFTEYLLPAYKWDETPSPEFTHEHPDEFLKRMWDTEDLMPTYTKEPKPCYCVKKLMERPEMDPPDKHTVAKHYRDNYKTVYHHEICHPEDNYVPLKRVLWRSSTSLPENWDVPLTTQKASYRTREISAQYMDITPPKPFKRVDETAPNERIREIMKVKTGDSEYEGIIGDLGAMIIRKQMHGDVKRREVATEYEIQRQLQKLK